MKKLFTLIAFLAVVMGAKAEWVDDYKIDYSTHTGFPFYVMGYVPEWVDGVMTDYGSMFKYEAEGYEVQDGETIVGQVSTGGGAVYDKVQLSSPGWHQYFIADGVPTEIDGAIRVTAYVKASEACSINVNLGWGWGEGQQKGATVAIGTDWQEVEWDYSGIGGTSCNLVAQPGGSQAVIEWKWVKVQHNAKPAKPKEWIELLDNTVTPSAQYINKTLDDFVRINALTEDEKGPANYELVKACPEVEIGGEKAYVAHSLACSPADFTAAGLEGQQAWANQFFIVSPTKIKAGDQLKISFDYKAAEPAKTNTQAHGLPTYYHHWECVGDVNFTTEWQTLTKEVSVADAWAGADGMYSIAFNLNPDNCNENDFYFKNLSIAKLKLDEGYFLAGANTKTGLEYDLDNAVEFTFDEEEGLLVATIGEEKEDTWVNQIMISTVRGDDASFKTNTLKPEGTIVNDPEDWHIYAPAGIAKLNLPSAGQWKVYLDLDYNSMAFEMLVGEAPQEPIDIKPNPTEIVINATERDWKPAKTGEGVEPNTPQDGEDGIGTGQAWDNQFFLKADRVLETGEELVIEFDYMATAAAPAGTQCQNGNFGYIHWDALGTINFTTEWQHFKKDYKVPADCKDQLQVFAFNLSEIKAANEYHIKNIVWKTADNFETLINMTEDNGENFFVKTNAGGVVPNGIETVKATTVKNNAIYNLAGQRVSKDYKGIAIKNGVKYIVK